MNNISSLFLIPATGIEAKLYNSFSKRGFVNSYCFCNKIQYGFPVLFLLFDNSTINKTSRIFFNSLKKQKNYMESFDAEVGLVMVFKIEKVFIEDYKLILNGAYSKTSTRFQKLFDQTALESRCGKVVRVYTLPYHVFNKTDFWKNKLKSKLGYTSQTDLFDDIDLYDCPKEEEETLMIEILVC